MLGDLGLARTTDELNDRLGGSPTYIAPEIFDDQGSERSDLFALGMMLYEFAHPGHATDRSGPTKAGGRRRTLGTAGHSPIHRVRARTNHSVT